MGIDAAFRPIFEHPDTIDIYETIGSVQHLATRIGFITKTRAEQVALVTISLRFEHEGKAHLRQSAVDRSTIHYLNTLCCLVHKTDVVYRLHHTFHFVLLDAAIQGGAIVQSRLWDALLWHINNTNNREILRPHSMTIGYSAYPAPYADIHQCITAASEVYMCFDAHPKKIARKTNMRLIKFSQAAEMKEDEEELLAVARKLGIPYLSPLPRKSPEQVQQLIDTKLVQELHCYPLGRERGILTVAIANPHDNRSLDRLHQETGLHIFPVLASPRELQLALDQLF